MKQEDLDKIDELLGKVYTNTNLVGDKINLLVNEIRSKDQTLDLLRRQVNGLLEGIEDYKAQISKQQKALDRIAPWLSASLSAPHCLNYEYAVNDVLELAKVYDPITKEEIK